MLLCHSLQHHSKVTLLLCFAVAGSEQGVCGAGVPVLEQPDEPPGGRCAGGPQQGAAWQPCPHARPPPYPSTQPPSTSPHPGLLSKCFLALVLFHLTYIEHTVLGVITT